ncbi:hypothetical protein RB598_002170 [Gaeumannomyces tritici]
MRVQAMFAVYTISFVISRHLPHMQATDDDKVQNHGVLRDVTLRACQPSTEQRPHSEKLEDATTFTPAIYHTGPRNTHPVLAVPVVPVDPLPSHRRPFAMRPINLTLALWALSQLSPAAGAALQDSDCQGGGTAPPYKPNKAYPFKWCDADDYGWRISKYDARLHDEYKRPWPLNGTRWCGIYDTGWMPNARTLISETPHKMEYDDWKTEITIPPKTCLRIKCWNTTGLYMCNARLHEITVNTIWDVLPALRAANVCCSGQPISIIKQRVSGEWRHPCGWSAIVAYANCNHPAVTPWPSKIWPMQNGSNPNGHCLHGTEEELLAPELPFDAGV